MVNTVLCLTQFEFIVISYLVPSGPPQNLVLSVMFHSIILSWSPPLLSQRNGVIINYLITCSSGGSIINSTRTSSTSLTITGLQPFINSTCFVSAATIVGDGPPATVSRVTSDEDSEYTVYYMKLL